MDKESALRAASFYRNYLRRKGFREFIISRPECGVLHRADVGWGLFLMDGAEEAVSMDDLADANWLVGFVQGMLWSSGLESVGALAAHSTAALGQNAEHPRLELAECPEFSAIRSAYLAELGERGLAPAKQGRDILAPTAAAALEHAGWMLDEIMSFVAAGRLSKACRWLGFVQACFWANGVCSFTDTLSYHPLA